MTIVRQRLWIDLPPAWRSWWVGVRGTCSPTEACVPEFPHSEFGSPMRTNKGLWISILQVSSWKSSCHPKCTYWTNNDVTPIMLSTLMWRLAEYVHLGNRLLIRMKTWFHDFWLAPQQRYWQNRETANVGIDSSVGRAPARQSGGRRFKSHSSKFVFVHPNLSTNENIYETGWVYTRPWANCTTNVW